MVHTDKLENGTMRDFWDSIIYEHIRETSCNGLFNNIKDIALSFSLDGVQLMKIGTHSVWAIMIMNLNLLSHLRYKKVNLLCLGFVPSLSEPLDLTSFLTPFIKELDMLSQGIKAFDR